MQSKVTIADVALRARVSEATVSRVLNRPEIVSQATVKRVRDAMQALSFTPNRHARALNGFRNRTVGLLFFDDLRDLFTNQFWGEATSTVYESLFAKELDCNLIALGEPTTSTDRFRSPHALGTFLHTRSVDGFILVGNVNSQYEVPFGESDIPVVMWGRPNLPEANLTYVDSNNLDGASTAVSYLLGRGRQHIAIITGGAGLIASRDRYDGYARALRDAGHVMSDNLAVHGDFSTESGRAGMRRLLESGNPIDAVFAANDEMAIGAMEVLRECGRTVPDDVAVIGFDNTPAAAREDVGLTTMAHSYAEIGSELVEALTIKMQGRDAKSRLIETSLVLRSSA